MLSLDGIRQVPRGFTLLEVLITMIVLAIGLLGIASLQSKVQVSQVESYQRTQALLLLQDMVDRINSNRAVAASYVTGTATSGTMGASDTSQPSDCTTLAMGAARDKCEWSYALKGASEKSGSSNIGAMIGARGCVEQLQAINAAAGICTPGIYRVTVVWQGLNSTSEPSLQCASDTNYGPGGGITGYRRAVSAQLIVSVPGCT